jgi:hypothetical protein
MPVAHVAAALMLQGAVAEVTPLRVPQTPAMLSGCVQEAVVPPLLPAQLHCQLVPDKVSLAVVAVPAEQRPAGFPVHGGVPVAVVPLSEPQVPLTISFSLQDADVPPPLPTHVQDQLFPLFVSELA